MLLVDENIPIKEVRKAIAEIINPIKDFSDRWGIPFQYVDDVIKTDEMEEHIDEIVEYIKYLDDHQKELALKRVDNLRNRLALFKMSTKRLKPLEQFLIYNVLLVNKTQIELTEDSRLWEQYEVTNVSPAKINHLLQAACLKLLELLRYNQLKNGRLNFN